MSKLVLEREVITPTVAKQYLEANVHNRNLREAYVAQLAGAIKRGEWVETGDPIKFNGDGSLEDGQHRLAAVVRSGKRVPMWVARGVPKEAQEVVDTGASRTAGDMLKLRGFHDGNNLASVASVVWAYMENGQPIGEQGYLRPTAQQILQVVLDEPLLVERVKQARTFKRADPALPIPPRVVGGLMHIFATLTDEEDSAGFFGELLTPSGAATPTGLVRSRLLRGTGLHKRIPPMVTTALVIKAWNAWIAGERPTRLTWRAGGATKEEFPTIRGRVE